MEFEIVVSVSRIIEDLSSDESNRSVTAAADAEGVVFACFLFSMLRWRTSDIRIRTTHMRTVIEMRKASDIVHN